MQTPLPGKGWMGWLGRQIGYIRAAVDFDPAAQQVVYRNDTVKEVAYPDQPGVKLRRTTVDEVIVEKKNLTSDPGPVQQ